MKPYTTGAKTVFRDRNSGNIQSVMTNIIDMNTFTAKVAEERQLKKPKLILGADDSTNKCIIVGMVVEADEEIEVQSLSKYKNTGQNRVLLLAKADDVPESSENYDILLNSLHLHNVSNEFENWLP